MSPAPPPAPATGQWRPTDDHPHRNLPDTATPDTDTPGTDSATAGIATVPGDADTAATVPPARPYAAPAATESDALVKAPSRRSAGGSALASGAGAVAADVRARRRRVVRLAVVLGVVAGCCVASAPVSAPAWAQEAGVVVLAQAESIDQVLINIRGWLMGILAGLATVMATVGGIRYTMADGDPGEIQRAKTAFRSAGLGFALAALAPLLVTVLQGLVGL